MNQPVSSLNLWLALLPATGLIILLVGGSALFVLVQSLGYAPGYGINEFPTLKYYSQLINNPGFGYSVWLTSYYAVVATIIATILGIILALILRKQFKIKPVTQHLYKYPLMVPYLVGIALVVLLFSQSGIVARVALALGFIERPAEFPALLFSHQGWGIIMVYVWKQMPFMTLSIYTLLIHRDPGLDDAAQLLGASAWQRFWKVTLPPLIPGTLSAALICFAFNFGAFEVPFILGGGFPETLPVQSWRLFNDPDYQHRLQGMAIIMFTFVALLVIFWAQYRLVSTRPYLRQSKTQ